MTHHWTLLEIKLAVLVFCLLSVSPYCFVVPHGQRLEKGLWIGLRPFVHMSIIEYLRASVGQFWTKPGGIMDFDTGVWHFEYKPDWFSTAPPPD